MVRGLKVEELLARLREGAKGAGQWSNQSATGDTQGYDVTSATYRMGVQHQIAPNWYLGASFAAGKTWATMNGTAGANSSGDGHTFDGSIALKHTMGPWFAAGSVAFASGSFNTDRLISLPGESALLKGDPSIFLAGGRLRAGYQFLFNDWYIRPYGDLDVIHSNLAGFRESGPALYALDVRESSKTSVVLTPMVEFGGRLALDEETTLRPFAAFGVSILPDNTRAIDASFVGASPADGTFRNFIKSPEVLGNIDLGVQLYRADGFEVKAEYKVNIGESFLSQRVSARLAYHF